MSTTLLIERAPLRDHALGEPRGRRADLDVADEARGVARAQLGVVDRRRSPSRRPARPSSAGVDAGHRWRRGRRRRRPRARRRRPTGSRAGSGVISSSRTVSESPAYSAKGMPTGRIGRQDQQPVVVVAEPELACRAVHAARLDTAQLGLLDRHAVRAASRRRARPAPCRRPRSSGRRTRSAAARRRRRRPW